MINIIKLKASSLVVSVGSQIHKYTPFFLNAQFLPETAEAVLLLIGYSVKSK